MIKKTWTLREAHEVLKEHVHHPHVRKALEEQPKAPRIPQDAMKSGQVPQHSHPPRKLA